MHGVTSRTVLIVEDEPLIGMDLQQLLEDAGYEVLGPAPSVQEALRCIEGASLRGAVVDLNLRGEMTGPVVQELLRCAVPVVLLTGYSSKVNAAPYNACPIVRKPYENANLLHVLSTAFDQGLPPSIEARRPLHPH